VTLYQGDCRDVLSEVGKVDAVISDPPYGINYEASRYAGSQFKGVLKGDEKDFDPSLLLTLHVPATVIWGGNNFSDKLPRGGWFVWDKRCSEEADRMLGSPFELAWVSDKSKFRMKRLKHAGYIHADGGKVGRVHPTQKPIELMAWCMEQVKVPRGAIVIDPYMGSGSTGMACMRTFRNFIGIEIDPIHFETSVRRLRKEASKGNFGL